MRAIFSFLIVLNLLACQKNENEPTFVVGFPHAYVVGGGGLLDLINLDEQSLVKSYQINEGKSTYPHHIYSDFSGRYFAIANPSYDFSQGHDGLHGNQFNGEVLIFDAAKEKVVEQIAVPFANHNAVFSPNGKEIWTSLYSHTARALNFERNSGNKLAEITLDADPSEIIFSEDGRYLLICSNESTFLQIIDPNTKAVIKKVKVDVGPDAVWPGLDGKVIVSNSFINSINIVDVAQQEVVDFLDLKFKPGFSIFRNTSSELWITSPKTDEVYIYRKINNVWEQEKVLELPGEPHAIQFYEDWALIVAQQNNSLSFYNIITQETKTITISAKPNGLIVLP